MAIFILINSKCCSICIKYNFYHLYFIRIIHIKYSDNYISSIDEIFFSIKNSNSVIKINVKISLYKSIDLVYTFVCPFHNNTVDFSMCNKCILSAIILKWQQVYNRGNIHQLFIRHASENSLQTILLYSNVSHTYNH